MSIGHGRRYGDEANMAPAPGNLAGEHASGGLGFSGMVPAGVAFTDPSAGITNELGRELVQTNPQHGSDLAKIPDMETRPMLGGVRSAPAYDTLREGVAFDGSHVTLANRHRSVVVLAVTEQMLPADPDQFPSLRVPPVSDPLGRICANAQAGGKPLTSSGVLAGPS
jgi:hypothetical protein